MTNDGCLFDVETTRDSGGRVQPLEARAASMRRTRNMFRKHPAPTVPMSRARFRPTHNLLAPPPDLRHIVAFFEASPDGRERFRWTLRDSLDEALDGQRTGRWCYQHLRKTEKTYLGTAIEINLTREWEISDGKELDWNILGTEVDCKFSRDIGGWEIPMEMYVCSDHGTQSATEDHPALLVWMNDDTNEWAAGILRITDDGLRWRRSQDGARVRAYNRDNKRRITEDALERVYWLWGGIQSDLPPNLLLHLPHSVRDDVLAPGSSGQGRVDSLFRNVQNRLINRSVVLTVGQQDDAPKRVRDARTRLRREGIIILGHEQHHQSVAISLGLDIPHKGSWISTRVTPVSNDEDRARFFLDGQWWAQATKEDDVVAAPEFKGWDQLRFADRREKQACRLDITWGPK
ncbi:NaeI family type II restriction endonuclease [Rhodococcus rhodochrous]|uniref:NaeI family type II restriction endonuclease n=1 Tax=Rhodococcus rhodochrous TaxID=1829 RepID=UPI001E47B059|nr:NaeI family type II restriction endonuclease [Rhodococcus rhodochrous]MCD2100240.1 restriction endonuclease [Rhodococcus rhodochrous]MCD2124598.1 restriction endonuclease [Rhodococcus rhodochrous]MCQ4137611.1 restriction endonuclease [Rhodococcus rhodochrous]MDJ0021394.1 NaeI family type II restriction endonuclease [Rhodococcus rhodochrous]